MSGRLASRRWRRAVCAGAVLYGAVLVAVPFEHHDLVCHLKTPQHCTSCVSSPPGSAPHAAAAAAAHRLADAGRALALQSSLVPALFAAGTTGRSPPSIA